MAKAVRDGSRARLPAVVLPVFWSSVWAGGPTLTFPNAPDCDARSVEIAMVGDVMQHGMQLRASRQPDGGYSWRGVFDAIAPVVSQAELAIANLETPVDEGQSFGGYPLFNAPTSLLDALDEAGFDVLQTANNHCLDRSRSGALATLDAVAERGFLASGTHRSAEDRDEPWVLATLPGPVTVAFIGYTYGTNGRPIPPGEPWLVNLLDAGVMQDDIERARAVADIVVAGIHWGAEYRHRPGAWQRELAQSLVDAGADVVMGSHPHVLQPAEILQSGDRDALVLYSLGNFVSNQRTPHRDGGLIARVTVATCVESGTHHVVDARFTPVWVDDRLSDGSLAFRVLPVRPEGEACPTGLDLSVRDCQRMDAFRNHTATLFDPARFSWAASPTTWTAARPARMFQWDVHDPAPVDLGSVWPPPAMGRTQADAIPVRPARP